MTRDPLDQLRAVNPVPQPVAYADDDVARRVADILTHDGQLPASIGAAPDRPTRSRWLPAGLVAAAVLVLAVVSAVVVTRGDDHDHAAGAAPVTCAVSTAGGTRAVKARLTQAEDVVRTRLTRIHGTASSFVTDTGDGILGFTPKGVSVRAATQACRSSAVAIRPVVSHLVVPDTAAPRSADPLSTLTFTVPPTGTAYARLTAAQRARLDTAMSHFDCALPRTATAPGLACLSSGQFVALLGPALITGADVRSADATAPAPGSTGGLAEWSVQLALNPAGGARLQAFTAAHHSADPGAELFSCGGRGRTPCADFLALTVEGRVESVPVTSATIAASVRLNGGYDQYSAQQLAADYTAAAVQLHPR